MRGWLGITMWHVLCAHTVTSVLCAQTTVLRSLGSYRLIHTQQCWGPLGPVYCFPYTHTSVLRSPGTWRLVPCSLGTYLWPPGPDVSAPSRWAGRGLCGTPHCSGWQCSVWSASSRDHPPLSASCPSSSQNLHGIWSVHRKVSQFTIQLLTVSQFWFILHIKSFHSFNDHIFSKSISWIWPYYNQSEPCINKINAITLLTVVWG